MEDKEQRSHLLRRLADCQAAIRKTPESGALHHECGVVLEALGKKAAAHRAFDRASIRSPEVIAFRVDRDRLAQQMLSGHVLAEYIGGMSKLRSGDHEEALACFERVVGRDPSSAYARFFSGMCLLELSRLSEAIQAFDESLKYDSDDAETWNCRGVALLRSARYRDAEFSFRRALHIDEAYSVARLGLADTLRDVGCSTEALSEYNRIIREDPQIREAYLSLGVLLANSNRLGDAITITMKGAGLWPNDAALNFNCGLFLKQAGRWKEALHYLELSALLDPTDADTHAARGRVLIDLGRPTEGRDAIRRSIELNPQDTSLRMLLKSLDSPGIE